MWYYSPEFAVSTCAGRDCMAPGSPFSDCMEAQGKIASGLPNLVRRLMYGRLRCSGALRRANVAVRQQLNVKCLFENRLVDPTKLLGAPSVPRENSHYGSELEAQSIGCVEGTDGVLLRVDLHRLLDRGMAELRDGRFWIHEDARNEDYAEFDGRTLE